MKREDFYYLSSDKKTQIHAVRWLPEVEVKAILQVAHGVTEHILRYEELAEYLTKEGIAVIGNDHLGHGTSIAEDSEPMYFGPEGSWNWVVEDIKTCMELTRKEYPNTSYYLLGFSLGSFVTRTYLIKYPETLNGAIIVGTGQTPLLQIAMAKYLANKEAKKEGEDKSTPIIRKLTFETYNKRFKPNRTDYDWLCASNDSLDKYIVDPLRGRAMSSGLFREMLNGMDFTSRQENVDKMRKDIPILFLSGEEDPVGKQGKGVKRAYKSFKKSGIKDVSIKIYPGLRHDILHEDCRKEIFAEIYKWIEKK